MPEQTATCPNGHELSATDAFCRECGAAVRGDSPEPRGPRRRPAIIVIAVLALLTSGVALVSYLAKSREDAASSVTSRTTSPPAATTTTAGPQKTKYRVTDLIRLTDLPACAAGACAGTCEGAYSCSARPSIATSDDALWVTTGSGVLRYDPLLDTAILVPVDGGSTQYGARQTDSIAFGDGAVWTASRRPLPPQGPARLTRIDATTNRVTESVDLPGGADAVTVAEDGAVWVAGGDENDDGVVATRLGTSSSPATLSIPVAADGYTTSVAAGADRVWIGHTSFDPDTGAVSTLDPAGQRIAPDSAFGSQSGEVVEDGASIWITSEPTEPADADAEIQKLNADTLEVATTVSCGAAHPGLLAKGGGVIWASGWSPDIGRPILCVIDPSSGKVVQTVELGTDAELISLAFGSGAAWVSWAEDGNSVIARIEQDSSDTGAVTTEPAPSSTTMPPTTTSAPTPLPGSTCSLGSNPDCIDPEGDGTGTFLIGGADCMDGYGPESAGFCSDPDGDGMAGYIEGGDG